MRSRQCQAKNNMTVMATTSSEKYLRHGIFELWHDKSYEDLGVKYKNQVAIIKGYAESISDGGTPSKGFMITGNFGQGKSLVLNCLFKQLVDMRKPCLLVPFTNVVRDYVAIFDGRSGNFDSLLNVQYLGIDDVGKELGTAGTKNLATAALDKLLSYRGQRKRPTMFTTNFSGKQIAEKYSDGIASLIKEFCTIVVFTGDDFRNTYKEVHE